jgi:hypothetical protein
MARGFGEMLLVVRVNAQGFGEPSQMQSSRVVLLSNFLFEFRSVQIQFDIAAGQTGARALDERWNAQHPFLVIREIAQIISC